MHGSSLDSRWIDLDLDSLVDIILDSFYMESGHIYKPLNNLALASFPVGEIEIDLNCIDLSDGVELKDIESECIETQRISAIDACIKGEYAYVSTDTVWEAFINVDDFNYNIDLHFSRESF